MTYSTVLRDRRLATLIGGDAVAKLGDGVGFVALPLLALQVRGAVDPATAVSAVLAAPFLLPIAVTVFFGAGRRRFDSRLVVALDGLLRAATFGAAWLLAHIGRLTLGLLIGGLFVGCALRLLSSSGRRLLATGMAGEQARLPVNGLLGISDSLALYVAGPALGGLISAVTGPAAALAVAAVCYATLPIAAATTTTTPFDGRTGKARSGWEIIRRHRVAARLLVVVFLFNLCYGPVEVALPLLVTGDLAADAGALGTLWTCFGAGALLGAALTSQLRRFRPRTSIVAVIAGWAAAVAALAAAGSIPVAALAFTIGGVIYGPFTAIAYTYLQDHLDADEQQPVLTFYAAGVTLAAPLGLGLAGPLIALLGARGGLAASAALTAALAPAVRWWITPHPRR
ncbi:hypothetical protein FHR83_008562 [Actinoplanes campanulatus]|uniref:Major Facilitator Superfamily protein n=1 Tax=Actinoplanes campanulatus TaxID=113559 RepID=A0A7W5AR58_9ACTN|nr:MFS transporter [Actinoplanes campanulatus]MBB3100836.1 hypothetical protein [Actinoplanes campanulatus]GGN46374.1 hypothetical protein GCM10010109_81470 [Actinoplanes campanulatus]GID41252.1 hypothetical protein Aca09nite_77580 [Actinoplanes campanulatus]